MLVRWRVALVATALVVAPHLAEAQVTVTVTKNIDAGSDQSAVFIFAGVPGSPLGHAQSTMFVFTAGSSSVAETLPDATWQLPTVTCSTGGMFPPSVVPILGGLGVTITDAGGGIVPGSANCTFTNRQMECQPSRGPGSRCWLPSC